MAQDRSSRKKQQQQATQLDAPLQENKDLEVQGPSRDELGAVEEQTDSPIIDGLMAGGEDDDCEDVGAYRTGERVGTWHGVFSDAQLEAGNPIDAGSPISEPNMTRQAAIALARTAGMPAVVVSDGEAYVVHQLVVRSNYPFTSDGVTGGHGYSDLTGEPGVEAFVTQDAVLYEVHEFAGKKDASALYDRNDQPAAGGSPTAGIKDVHGEGLEDFKAEDGTKPSGDALDELIRTFGTALRDVALDRLDASEREANAVAESGNTDQIAGVAAALLPISATFDALKFELAQAVADAHPLGSGGDLKHYRAELEVDERNTELQQSLREQMQAQHVLSTALIAQAPVLQGLDTDQLTDVAAGKEGDIAARTADVLGKISQAREYIIEGGDELWHLPRLVQWAKVEVGLDDPGLIQAIDEHAAEVAYNQKWWEVLWTTLSIGLGAVAIYATWGAAAPAVGAMTTTTTGVLGAGSATVGVFDFAQQYHIADREQSLVGTDFADAENFIDPKSVNDETAALLLSLIAVKLDVLDAVALIRLARAGKTSGEAFELALATAPDQAKAKALLKEAGLLDTMEEAADTAVDVKGALKAGLSPEATETLNEAYRAADDMDLQEVRRLHAQLEERGLDKNSAHALWTELTDRIWARGLDTVDMAGESHTLRMGYENGEFVLLLCSDCAALSKTLAWLTGHPAVTEDPGLLALVQKLSREVDAVTPDAAPDTSAIRATLEAIGEEKGIACLTCLVDAPVAGLAQNFDQTLNFVGKRLSDAMADEAFKGAYEPYVRGGKQFVRRKDGPTGDFPELEVDAEGILTWRKAASRAAATKLDVSAMDAPQLLTELMGHSESIRKYVAAVEDALGWKQDRIAAILGDATKGYQGETSVDVLRHALKVALREPLLDDIVAAGQADSVRLINELTPRMNAADGGNLAEAWLMKHRQAFDGANPDDYLKHASLDQASNPAMKGDRDADLAKLGPTPEGDDPQKLLLNEVKSGSGPLSKDHDIPQIEDLLAATKDGATVTKGGQGYEASQVVVTFTDVRKARASVGKLADWLRDYKGFVLEVFDSTGSTVRITQQNKMSVLARAKVTSLAEFLDGM